MAVLVTVSTFLKRDALARKATDHRAGSGVPLSGKCCPFFVLHQLCLACGKFRPAGCKDHIVKLIWSTNAARVSFNPRASAFMNFLCLCKSLHHGLFLSWGGLPYKGVVDIVSAKAIGLSAGIHVDASDARE